MSAKQAGFPLSITPAFLRVSSPTTHRLATHSAQWTLHYFGPIMKLHKSLIVLGSFDDGEVQMATLGLIEYEQASPEVRAVYDDIMATRKTERVNNFWKAIAHDPTTLRRTWQSVKEIMIPGALDALTKEMIYVAVSVTNQCNYCIASHTAAARKAGMTDAMFAEVMAVVGMANETNRLATGYQVEIDEQFKS
jgi:AhpD family alkylhydroperoxidase